MRGSAARPSLTAPSSGTTSTTRSSATAPDAASRPSGPRPAQPERVEHGPRRGAAARARAVPGGRCPARGAVAHGGRRLELAAGSASSSTVAAGASARGADLDASTAPLSPIDSVSGGLTSTCSAPARQREQRVDAARPSATRRRSRPSRIATSAGSISDQRPAPAARQQRTAAPRAASGRISAAPPPGRGSAHDRLVGAEPVDLGAGRQHDAVAQHRHAPAP